MNWQRKVFNISNGLENTVNLIYDLLFARIVVFVLNIPKYDKSKP